VICWPCRSAPSTSKLYRGLAGNSVGRVIENILRPDLVILDEVGFAPLDDTGASCCSGSSPPPTNAEPSASAPSGPSTNGTDSYPSTPLPSACSIDSCTTASSVTEASRSACAKPEPAQEDAPPTTENHRGMGTFTWPPAATCTWPLTPGLLGFACDVGGGDDPASTSTPDGRRGALRGWALPGPERPRRRHL
jgi:hypothetical protein